MSTCHMCGSTATKRLTPDLDIRGIPLCDDKKCRDTVDFYFAMAAMNEPKAEQKHQRQRKAMHKAKGNKFVPEP